jgi:hypothetical protein
MRKISTGWLVLVLLSLAIGILKEDAIELPRLETRPESFNKLHASVQVAFPEHEIR